MAQGEHLRLYLSQPLSNMWDFLKDLVAHIYLNTSRLSFPEKWHKHIKEEGFRVGEIECSDNTGGVGYLEETLLEQSFFFPMMFSTHLQQQWQQSLCFWRVSHHRSAVWGGSSFCWFHAGKWETAPRAECNQRGTRRRWSSPRCSPDQSRCRYERVVGPDTAGAHTLWRSEQRVWDTPAALWCSGLWWPLSIDGRFRSCQDLILRTGDHQVVILLLEQNVCLL